MHVIFVCGHTEIWNSDFKGDFRFPLKETRDGFMEAIETEIFSVTRAVYVKYKHSLKTKHLKAIV